jgi:hypothetical protein
VPALSKFFKYLFYFARGLIVFFVSFGVFFEGVGVGVVCVEVVGVAVFGFPATPRSFGGWALAINATDKRMNMVIKLDFLKFPIGMTVSPFGC